MMLDVLNQPSLIKYNFYVYKKYVYIYYQE